MKFFFKNLIIYLSIYFINFLSISFFWIQRKFGKISFENLQYHLNSLFDKTILIPDHHLQESFIFYAVKINFILSFIIYLIWLLLFMTSNKNKFKKIFLKLNSLLVYIFKYKLIFLLLNLIVIFSFVSLIKNLDLNTDKKTSLKDYYFKLQTMK